MLAEASHLTRQPLAVLARWPVTSVLACLPSLRRAAARRALAEFNSRLAASRGGEDGVRRVRQALAEQAGVFSGMGTFEDLAAELAGGA